MLLYLMMMLEKRLRSSVKMIVVDDEKNGFDIDVEKKVNLLIDVQIKTSNFKYHHLLSSFSINIIHPYRRESMRQFLDNNPHEKLDMIISGSFGQLIMSRRVHNLLQIHSIFIFCTDKDCISLCHALKQTAQQCEQNIISMNIINRWLKRKRSFSFDHSQTIDEKI